MIFPVIILKQLRVLSDKVSLFYQVVRNTCTLRSKLVEVKGKAKKAIALKS